MIVLGTHDFDLMRITSAIRSGALPVTSGARYHAADVRRGSEPILWRGTTIRATFGFAETSRCTGVR